MRGGGRLPCVCTLVVGRCLEVLCHLCLYLLEVGLATLDWSVPAVVILVAAGNAAAVSPVVVHKQVETSYLAVSSHVNWR